MKATHKLKSPYGEWLLRCAGNKHWWCKTKGEYADSVWHGPTDYSVEEVFSDDSNFVLIKLNQFKGNK